MYWEILIAVIIAIGIYTAIVQMRIKRTKHANHIKGTADEQNNAKNTSNKRD